MNENAQLYETFNPELKVAQTIPLSNLKNEDAVFVYDIGLYAFERSVFSTYLVYLVHTQVPKEVKEKNYLIYIRLVSPLLMKLEDVLPKEEYDRLLVRRNKCAILAICISPSEESTLPKIY